MSLAPSNTDNNFFEARQNAAARADTKKPRPLSNRSIRRLRGSRHHCDHIAYMVRGIACLTGLAMAVLAIFGFSLASDLFGDDTDSEVPYIKMSYKRLAIYLGAMCVYYLIFAVLMILGEIRITILKQTVLKPFGFMHTLIGRGVFYVVIGFVLVAVGNLFTVLVGGFTAGCGIVEVTLSILIKKERAQVTSENPAHKGKGADIGEKVGDSSTVAINWGEDSSISDDTSTAASNRQVSEDDSTSKWGQPSDTNTSHEVAHDSPIKTEKNPFAGM